MPRSRLQNRKPRYARRTAQIVVEGHTEEAFCKHLKRLRARDCGVRVDIHNARGGSPKDVVKSALNRNGYDRTIVLFDSDLRLPETWKRKAESAGFILVIPDPCIEAFLLELLGHSSPLVTSDCKRAFDEIIPPPSKFTPDPYAHHFTNEVLNQSTSELLKKILLAFE